MQFGDNQFHIDPGPGSLNMAKNYGINLRANTALLVSHNTINHANDINAVLSAMTHGGFDKRGVLVAANNVINSTETSSPYLRDYYKNCIERFIYKSFKYSCRNEPSSPYGYNYICIIT